jgi:predicted nucleotidyltransferase
MDLSEPASAVAPGVTIALLRAVASNPGTTADSVVRLTRQRSLAQARQELDRLTDLGLLIMSGPNSEAVRYELNRDHLLYPAVQALLAVDDELTKRLREEISAWAHPPICTALIGSAARREGGPRTDVELLVVRPAHLHHHAAAEWDKQLHHLEIQVRVWTGNALRIFDRTTEDLLELTRSGASSIDEWQRDAVSVHGRDLRDLIVELT